VSATALYAAGYTDLVKVARGDKRPVMTGWQDLQVTAEMAAAWDTEGMNIGLRGDRFPAVDIDLGNNTQIAEEIVQLAARALGGAPKRFSPKPGSRLLVYATDERFLKMTLTLPNDLGAVEVLPAGRQYLVKGTHPAGGPYAWNKRDLWDIDSARLTKITEAKALKFLELVRQEYGGRIHVAREAKESALSPEELMAPSIEAVEELLRSFPNNDAFLALAFPSAGDARDTWVALGHAVKGAAGEAGLPAFLEWTSRYEDGVADLALAESAYHGFHPERYGWPTLQRIYTTLVVTPDDVFADDITDEEEEVVSGDVRPPTEEDMVSLLLPYLKPRIVYVAGSWWVWGGAKWEADDKEGLRAEMILREKLGPMAAILMAQGEGMGKEGAPFRTAAKRFQSADGIRAVFRLCRGPLSKEMSDFDRDVMALNTPAGLVDLRSGKSRATEPGDYVSRSTSAVMPDEYIEEKAPHWEAFLEYLSHGDEEYKKFLQRYMGYSLTGNMGEKKLVFIYGAASNTGKSTFVNAILYAMGDYAASVDVDMFMSRNRSNTDDLAQLPGVRLVTATEPSAGQKWDDKLIKSVTGGDPIIARRLYQSHFTFNPQFKILIAGNHQPELKNVDTALLKRVMIAPMDRVATNPDRTLGLKLQDEAGMILRWMLEGCIAWQRDGLAPPPRVVEVTEAYEADEDTMAAWLDEECEFSDEAWTTTEELYQSWQQWMNRQGVRFIPSSRLFNRELSSRTGQLAVETGFDVRRLKRNKWGYKGLELKTVRDF